MNARILELIKHPETISAEDIPIIEGQSAAMPYAQAFRALRLKAAHKHTPDSYAKILSKTAAYTTDKKILYQLINGKTEQEPMVLAGENLPEPASVQLTEPVSIVGGANRILFEGEENFMNEEIPEIHSEPTKESGKNASAPAAFPQLKISEKEETPSEKTEIQENTADAEINFYQSEDFLPKTFPLPKREMFTPKNTDNKQSRAELEMQRLIAEVEAKMQKNKKNQSQKQAEEPASNEINFAETQIFEVKASEKNHQEKVEASVQTTAENRVWKPMNFSGNTPDALLNIPKEETKSETSPAENILKQEKSNVPSFITTWQNWLKLSTKKEETKSEETTQAEEPQHESQLKISLEPDKKEQIIESFIESNPKITKLKEDVQFSVKEKDDDISHLMTETLAKLYLEQRLYSKAINAYEVLIKKFPERKKEFTKVISEIKEMRPGK